MQAKVKAKQRGAGGNELGRLAKEGILVVSLNQTNKTTMATPPSQNTDMSKE